MCEVGYVRRIRAVQSRYRIMAGRVDGSSSNLRGQPLTWGAIMKLEVWVPSVFRDKPSPSLSPTADCCVCVYACVPVMLRNAWWADRKGQKRIEVGNKNRGMRGGINANSQLYYHILKQLIASHHHCYLVKCNFPETHIAKQCFGLYIITGSVNKIYRFSWYDQKMIYFKRILRSSVQTYCQFKMRWWIFLANRGAAQDIVIL